MESDSQLWVRRSLSLGVLAGLKVEKQGYEVGRKIM